MQTTHRNVVDAHISFMASAELHLFDCIEVYNMHLSLLLLSLRVSLVVCELGLNHYIVLSRLRDLESSVRIFADLVIVFKFLFAQLAVESLPSVGSHMWPYLLVLGPGSPLLQALQMNVLHAARASARIDQWIRLWVCLLIKTDSANDDVVVGFALIIGFRSNFVIFLLRHVFTGSLCVSKVIIFLILLIVNL